MRAMPVEVFGDALGMTRRNMWREAAQLHRARIVSTQLLQGQTGIIMPSPKMKIT